MLIVTFGPIGVPHGGITVRAHMAARSFERLGCRVTVVSTSEAGSTVAPRWRVVEPDRAPKFGFSRSLVRTIASVLPEVDVVAFESALLLGAILVASARCRRRLPLLWDTTELETLHYSRLDRSAGVVARLCFWWALEMVASVVSDRVIAISEEEAGHWRRLFPPARKKTIAVPHAPMPASVAPGTDGSDATPAGRPPGGLPTVVFVGNAESKQNALSVEWICRELAPRLSGIARVVVAGAATDRVVAAFAGRADVEALGFVGDIGAVLSSADLAVAPVVAAAGVKTKVLQYLAYALPVVGTPTAFEGLDGVPGVEVAELDEFADAVIRRLGDPESNEAREERRAAQLSYVDERHGSGPVDEAWREVLTGVLGEAARGRGR